MKNPFWTRKFIIQKFCSKKKSRTHISEKGVWKVFLYSPHFLKTFSSFLLESGAVIWCKKQLSINFGEKFGNWRFLSAGPRELSSLDQAKLGQQQFGFHALLRNLFIFYFNFVIC